jgi:hypothetical protein
LTSWIGDTVQLCSKVLVHIEVMPDA